MESKDEKKPDLPDCGDLAPLEYFDPKVFQSSDKDEQKVCDFVLMLALVNNDFKDILWSHAQLNKCRRDVSPFLTAYGGQYGGMNLHLIRLVHSLIFELAELIEANHKVIEHKLFIETVKQTNKINKDCWAGLVAFSKGEAGERFKLLHKITCVVRNNISFHYYQPSFLGGGYKHFFSRNDKLSNKAAFISKGATLQNTRFYFADAAIQGCFDKFIDQDKVKELRPVLDKVSLDIVQALYDIVTSFIQLRGGGYYKYSPEGQIINFDD